MLGQVTAVKKGHLNISILPQSFFTDPCLALLAEVLQSKVEHIVSICEIQVPGKIMNNVQ